ncbi:hypothetical protein F2Q69_00042237 [Brassica cretica]|uniref:Uncharacterized protein n=1 Tax=Brassica cretica TaxID=69181 RepID=A0A8S9NHS4_BRACR|nr:hypothetical protein F2Q69_00042237 [Brassica cretica]
MPLIFELPEITWITRSCRGGKTGAALVGLPIVSLLRWPLAFSERNFLRCPFLCSSLTSIFSATQSSVEVAPEARVPERVGGFHLLRPFDLLAHLPQNIDKLRP